MQLYFVAFNQETTAVLFVLRQFITTSFTSHIANHLIHKSRGNELRAYKLEDNQPTQSTKTFPTKKHNKYQWWNMWKALSLICSVCVPLLSLYFPFFALAAIKHTQNMNIVHQDTQTSWKKQQRISLHHFTLTLSLCNACPIKCLNQRTPPFDWQNASYVSFFRQFCFAYSDVQYTHYIFSSKARGILTNKGSFISIWLFAVRFAFMFLFEKMWFSRQQNRMTEYLHAECISRLYFVVVSSTNTFVRLVAFPLAFNEPLLSGVC